MEKDSWKIVDSNKVPFLPTEANLKLLFINLENQDSFEPICSNITKNIIKMPISLNSGTNLIFKSRLSLYMTYNFIYSSTPDLVNAEIIVETNNKICQKDERYLSNPLSFDCNSFYKSIYVSSDKNKR